MSVIAWLRGGSGLRTHRLSGLLLGTALGYGAFAWSISLPSHAIWACGVLTLTAGLLTVRPSLPMVAFTAPAVFGAGRMISFYSNNWSWMQTHPARTVFLVSMLTIAPCALAALTAVQGGASKVAGLVSIGWILYLTLPAVPAWGPLLWGLALALLAAVVQRTLNRFGAVRPS
jgi:hypothetical protein